MRFNAVSLTKIGIGFGALAVASIGLLSPGAAQVEDTQFLSGGPDAEEHWLESIVDHGKRLAAARRVAEPVARVTPLEVPTPVAVAAPEQNPLLAQPPQVHPRTTQPQRVEIPLTPDIPARRASLRDDEVAMRLATAMLLGDGVDIGLPVTEEQVAVRLASQYFFGLPTEEERAVEIALAWLA